MQNVVFRSMVARINTHAVSRHSMGLCLLRGLYRFIDEDQNDSKTIRASAAALQKVFQTLKISRRLLEASSMRSGGTRVVHYDANNQLSAHGEIICTSNERSHLL